MRNIRKISMDDLRFLCERGKPYEVPVGYSWVVGWTPCTYANLGVDIYDMCDPLCGLPVWDADNTSIGKQDAIQYRMDMWPSGNWRWLLRFRVFRVCVPTEHVWLAADYLARYARRVEVCV